MSVKEIAIFLITLFSVYFLGNLYIYIRSAQALSLDGRCLNYYRVLFLLIVLCYPIAKIGTGFWGPFFLSKQLNIIGSIFMGVMLYCLLIILLVDIVRLLNHFFHFFPAVITNNKILAERITFCVLFFIIFCISVYGVYNAQHLRVIEQEIILDKLKPEHNGFTIVQISDTHLGDILGEKFLNKVIEKVNSLNPDVVVITGDLIDDGSTNLQRLNSLVNIKSKSGRFFVSGNHDHFYVRGSDSTKRDTMQTNDRSAADSSTDNRFSPLGTDRFSRLPLAAKLIELGITIVHNEYIEIESAFTLFGVPNRWGRRSNTDTLDGGDITKALEGYNKDLPLIMLKHVPNDLDDISDAGVDLVLCGHTHHGQLFPLTFITDKVYEISHGYGRYKNLQVYVNCGTGFWGPPLKVGVPAEITKITLRSK